MTFIPFDDVKAANPIGDVVKRLNITAKPSGKTLRASCPACGGERSLAITPDKNVWYCFEAETGGDQIALVAHVKGIGMKEAAQFLHTVPPKEDSRPDREGLQPLSHLDHGHDALIAIGFEPDQAKQLGIGWASKGIMRGHVAIPLRLEDGTLVGYLGIKDGKLPPQLRFPGTNVVPFSAKTA